MANINQVFGGNYLKAEDLQGRTVKVTINKVEVKEFDDGNKLVVHFQGKEKALVCNKTNASIFAENAGDPESDNWVGTTHSLAVKKVEYAGKLIPAIRVVIQDGPVPPTPTPKPSQRVAPQAQVESSEPDDSGEIPF